MSRVVTVNKSLGSYSDHRPAGEVNMERSDIPALPPDLQNALTPRISAAIPGEQRWLPHRFTGKSN